MADDPVAVEPLKFRTKSGECLVYEDRLVIERHGLRGAAAQSLQGNSKSRTMVVYGLVVALLVWLGWNSWSEGGRIMPFYCWIFSAWLVFWLVRNRNFSMTPEILRSETTKIVGTRGVSALTRNRFAVQFVRDGRPQQRFILMPGALQQGGDEFDRAIAVLRERGWPLEF